MKKKNNTVGLIISMVIVVVGFGLNIHAILHYPNLYPTAIAQLVMDVLIAIYAIWGYKKPHTNLLRNLFFVYAFALVAASLTDAILESYVSSTLYAVAAVLVAFMSGRLHKFLRNIWNIFVTIGLLVKAIFISTTSILEMLVSIFSNLNVVFAVSTLFCTVFTYIALVLVYHVRFKEHKLVGVLEDVANEMSESQEVKIAKTKAKIETLRQAEVYKQAKELKKAKKTSKKK